MRLTCVISGDLVASSKLSDEAYQLLIENLIKAIKEAGVEVDFRYQVFRGDSFQMEIRDVEQATRVALRIRLIMKFLCSGENKADLRLSIAFGETRSKVLKLGAESSAAHRLSGRGLDNLRKARLYLSSPSSEFNDRVAISTRFCDTILSELTPRQSQILALYLKDPSKVHEQIAEELQTTRVNIAQSLNAAHYHLIRDYAEEVSGLLRQYLSGQA